MSQNAQGDAPFGGVSLKYKLLVLLVAVPSVFLGAYLIIASRLFTDDKIAYVFDSNAALSRTLSAQARSEITGLVNKLEKLGGAFDLTAKTFNESGLRLVTSEVEWSKLFVIRPDENRVYQRLFAWSRDSEMTQEALAAVPIADEFIRQAYEKGFALRRMNAQDEALLFAIRSGPMTSRNMKILVLETQVDTFLSAFRGSGTYKSFLLDRDGNILVGASEVGEVYSDLKNWPLFEKIRERDLPEGADEVESPDGERLLASYSRIDLGGLLVASFIEKKLALRAVRILKMKSALFFLALCALAAIVSVFASGNLTHKLMELYEATRRISRGHFDVQVEVDSNDEVGSLGQSFNAMAKEVQRLLEETAEKARLKTELETAKTVQETLFPPSKSQIGDLAIAGHYQPASECGGDWWHYCEVGSKVFLFIGDATGHGAPAALITSAAKSAATVIEGLGEIPPSKALSLLNRAIHETSKGRMLMTFFLGVYDKETNLFTYCNASHDPPFFLKNQGRELKKKDIETLNEVVSPRLGEKLDSVYNEATVTMGPGDLVLFYTDGMNDIQNPKLEAWGERNFIKATLAAVNTGQSPEEMINQILTQAEAYRQGTALIDDMTFFMCRKEVVAS